MPISLRFHRHLWCCCQNIWCWFIDLRGYGVVVGGSGVNVGGVALLLGAATAGGELYPALSNGSMEI